MKKFISLCLGLLLIGIQACSAAPVRMGIELELQGITYENISGVTLMDHIRLFESEKKDIKKDSKTQGQPNWYLEVDGSGNIEFVSRPMELVAEKELLEQSLKEMNQLMSFILSRSKLIEDSNEPYFLFDFDESKEEIALNKLEQLGSFVHWKPIQKGGYENIKTNIQIKILDPFCVVRPQATFQIPLSSVQNLANYMAIDHKHLCNAIEEINKIFDNTLKIKDCGQGLAYLVMITSELLRNNHNKDELGPKGVLTLMSRTSFSKMYERLTKENKKSYETIISKYIISHGNKQLFNKPYALFYGEDIAKNAQFKIGLQINKIVVQDFLDSIITPDKYKGLFDASKDLLIETLKQKGQSNQDKSIGQLIYEELQNIENKLFDFRGTDLLSPPIFLRHTYSLGKYNNVPDDMAILEMRGYTGQYKNNIKMGQLVLLWLQREIENATELWEKIIIPLDFYRTKAAQVEKNYQELELKEIPVKTNMAKIERWFALGKTVEQELCLQNSFNAFKNSYAFFYKNSFENLEKDFLKESEAIQKQMLVEKKDFALKLLNRGGI